MTAQLASTNRRSGNTSSDASWKLRPRGRRAGGLSTALGVFSLGLGAVQVLMPGGVARIAGLRDDRRTRGGMRAVGLRELAAAGGIFASGGAPGWLWSRVLGDVLDLTLLGRALKSNRSRRRRIGLATAAVAGVTVLDVLGATRAASANRGSSTIRVQRSITVNRSREDLYQYWRDFTNLPRFMTHVQDVQVTGPVQSHWKVSAPGGQTVEWDAEVVEDRPNELIAWRSLPTADVDNEGSVQFTTATGGRGVVVAVDLRYAPPAGRLGRTVAALLGEEPSRQVADDLRRFKQVMETGSVVRSNSTPDGAGSAGITQQPAQPAAT